MVGEDVARKASKRSYGARHAHLVRSEGEKLAVAAQHSGLKRRQTEGQDCDTKLTIVAARRPSLRLRRGLKTILEGLLKSARR